MKFIENIDPQILNQMTETSPYSHYMMSSIWASLKKNEGYKIHYVGLEDNNEIIASSLVLEKKHLGTKYFYIPYGPVVDYNNEKVVRAFFQGLIDYGKKLKIDFIKAVPNVDHVDEKLTEILTSLNFKHRGYTYGYDGSWQNRYTLVIDLDKPLEEVKDNFSKARKSAIKKQDIYSITTRIGSVSEVNELCLLEKELTEIKGFKPHSPKFFSDIMDAFKDHAIYAIAEVNLKEALSKLDAEIHSKKYAKDKEALESKIASYNQIKGFHEKYGDKKVIAAGLFISIGHKSWDLYVYNHKEFNFMNGTDAIHVFMIEEMKKRNVTFYDMCGFSGSTDPSDPYYGIYLYKSSFGSEVVELVGEFTYKYNEKKVDRFFKMDRLLRKVRRKFFHILNAK